MKHREWLKEFRLNQELTQLQVANMTGVSLRYYQMIEQGRKTPGPTVASKLGNLMDFDWRKFYEET